MDVVGSEIGHKMRSAIKAKLTELGCYVDDELPDYVMVMVANKRTRAQMEDDLQLFLGDNTELFVNWLHQVLKKLQEVTVTAPLKPPEKEKSKEKSHSKERKAKGKKAKEKEKKSDLKKAKKKLKEKAHKKKEIEKPHKSKKSTHQEIIRPNIPPLFRNIEKESEPSITDVFAGQILKNHGISIDARKEDSIIDKKPIIKEKRPILPIIDPATITTNPEPVEQIPIPAKREEQLLEMNAIENKIQGLKQKLVEQLDSMSDDEDFLNIRTEAEELMNDFAEDVVQEITQQAPMNTPPLEPSKLPSPIHSIPNPGTQKSQRSPTKNLLKTPTESLPQIELNLPKRPVRERLGIREEKKKVQEPETRIDSPERFTPDREPGIRPQKSTKTRIEGPSDKEKKKSSSDDCSEEMDNSRKLNSRVSRGKCASVVRVRPRPRVATTTSSLLLKAVADAHKSLLNIPPKTNPEMQKVKRALVLPMRRTIDPQKIIIQVPTNEITHDDRWEDSISLGGDSNLDNLSGRFQRESNKEEYVPISITKKITNTDYVPSKRELRTSTRRDDSLVIETINIHNPTVDKDKSTKFIVTMDGFNPNAFLAKKLQSEGLLNDEETEEKLSKTDKKIENTKEPNLKEKQNAKEDLDLKKKFQRQEKESSTEHEKESSTEHKKELSIEHEKEKEKETQLNTSTIQAKRLSNTSDESDTQVIIKDVSGQRSNKRVEENPTEKRKSLERVKEESPPSKKRKASPIVFNVEKKERVRTESASSENHVITTNSSHKYDSLPPLSQAERKLVWCRAFPLCRYGSSCAFAHPRCKFAAACTRRNCVYSHAPNAVSPTTPAPSVASHVVPAANYKSISNNTPSNICKYYPSCANASCHFYHPKPCRYGKMCTNKVECNFYHADVPAKF